jgi:phage shock protein E
MKRIILVLAIFVVLALAACTAVPAAPASAPTSAPTSAPAPVATQVDISQLGPNVDVATVNALQGRDDVLILDVREQSEYDAGHIPGVTLIPLNDVANRLSEIPKDKPVIVTCRSGNRSGQATDFLRQQGYTNVHNMTGGLNAWQQAGYAVEK